MKKHRRAVHELGGLPLRHPFLCGTLGRRRKQLRHQKDGFEFEPVAGHGLHCLAFDQRRSAMICGETS
jgi:hypothetical protein